MNTEQCSLSMVASSFSRGTRGRNKMYPLANVLELRKNTLLQEKEALLKEKRTLDFQIRQLEIEEQAIMALLRLHEATICQKK